MSTRRASCSCGQLTATCEGDPIRVSMCHCLACQQRTGSVFSAQARWPRELVTLDGRSTAYVRSADSGNTITFHFCPNCGSTVYYFLNHMPNVIAIPIGGFADPNFPRPKISVYESRKHGWVTAPEDAEHHD